MDLLVAAVVGLVIGFGIGRVAGWRRHTAPLPDTPPDVGGAEVGAGDGPARALTDMAHELRTPLTLIVGNIESVQTGGGDRAPYRLEVARRNARRLHRMVEEFLELSRSEAGALELSPVTLDLVHFATIVVAGFETLADLKDVDLVLTAPDRAIPLRADPERLERVLYNLLSNAIKFAPGGRVEVDLLREGGWAILRVRDDGTGIAPEALPHVFDRFYRSPDPRARRAEGTGLGLALAREIVHLHHGEIAVESERDRGTCFTVRLPLAVGADAPARGVPIPARPSWLPPGGPSELVTVDDPHAGGDDVRDTSPLVLVVDDNREMRAYVGGCLRDAFRVVEAEDGESAFSRATELVPDLVVADLVMPGADGHDLVRRLRQERVTSHIPFVMLTGQAGEESRLKALEAGADDYLTKPFSHRELLARATNLVALRQLLRERYATAPVIHPEEVDATPVDQAFLASVVAEIEEHLSDRDFSVEGLARCVHLSTSQLTRKLRALVDQSPGRLIRSHRLQRAAELIRSGEGNLGTIAHRVGFSDQAHFSRSFKKQFGVPPSEYLGG